MNTFDEILNIVIPMAGLGSRFANAGYKEPKPLIMIHDKAMIEIVVDNVRPRCAHRFIFICQTEHVEQYNMLDKLHRIAPDCIIVKIDGLTEGAACTVLQAKYLIDSINPLMIVNSDQYVDCSIDNYLEKMRTDNLDGLIMTMEAKDPKWSFVGLESNNKYIARVAEKQVISNEATVGIYNFARGRDFVCAAEKMIIRNERVNGEFYVAPVYNILITENAYKAGIFNVGKERNGMYGLGTPSDLDYFLSTTVAKELAE